MGVFENKIKAEKEKIESKALWRGSNRSTKYSESRLSRNLEVAFYYV